MIAGCIHIVNREPWRQGRAIRRVDIAGRRISPVTEVLTPATIQHPTRYPGFCSILTSTLYSPVYGVIFLFKYLRPTADTGSNNNTKSPQDGEYDTSTAEGSDSPFFAAQTIQNACGTQAILSVILNHDTHTRPSASPSTASSRTIDIGPELRAFKDFTAGFPPDLRGEALSNSETIRTAHNAFARSSPFVDEGARPPEGDEEGADVYHFIAYTAVQGVLYELDGLQPYPISHGACGDDVFPERVISVLQKRIARYPPGETRFNVMAVTRDPRLRAAEIGDVETLEREAKKRAAWRWENTLRRANFVGFIGEVMKGVAGHRLQNGDKAFDDWVDGAKQETKRKLQR